MVRASAWAALALLLASFGLHAQTKVIGGALRKDGSGNVEIGPTLLDATWGLLIPVTVSSSGPVTIGKSGFWFNDAAGALTFNLPAITTANIGARFCIRNMPTRTGAITLQAPASTYISKDGANGSAAGTFVSAGALGDNVCVLAVTTTQYISYVGSGTWTAN